MRKRLKQPRHYAKAREVFNRHWIKVSLILLGVLLFAAGYLLGGYYTAHNEKFRAEQAEKRLEELKIQQAEEITELQAEMEFETERRIEEAEIAARGEMAEQLAQLNRELEEEQKAYEDLKTSMDGLMKSYQDLMNTLQEPLSVSQAPAEVASAPGPLDPRGFWFNTIIAPQMEVMNCWPYGAILTEGVKDPYTYQHLIDVGRQLVLNQPIFPCSEDYMKAAVVCYCGYKWDAWLAQMGYTHSRFYGEGLGCVIYLTERGVPWEYGLIVLEFESNFGVGAPGNPWGFISGSSGIEAFCDFAAGHTGSVYEFVEWYHNPEDAGHETYRFNFNNRMIQIQAFCP